MADSPSPTDGPEASSQRAAHASLAHSPVTPPGSGRARPTLRGRARLGGASEKRGRTGRAFSVSVALHLAVGAVVLQLLSFGHGLYSFIDPWLTKEPLQERVTFVEPKPVAPTPAPSKPQPVPAVPRAVTTGPVVGPGTPLAAPERALPDTGAGVGAGAATAGIGAVDPILRGAKPGYSDGRVWAPGAPLKAGPGRNGAERLDSVIASVLTMAADSLDSIARANGAYGRKPGDWTRTDKDGHKWGWDNAGIRLGKIVIPNALLSLLPLNAQVGLSGNPTSIDRERRLALARDDIQRNMTLGPGDAEFNKLKNELRQRRERERRDRLRAPDASIVTGPQKPGGS